MRERRGPRVPSNPEMRVSVSPHLVLNRASSQSTTAAHVSRRPTLPPALVLSASGDEVLPAVVDDWLTSLGGELVRVVTSSELMAIALRSRPRVAVLDARSGSAEVLDACRRLKSDSYTGIVPALVLVASDADVRDALDSGADEVLRSSQDPSGLEDEARLRALLRRSDRDTGVHPSTRLPGAIEIETEISRRLDLGERFAVCYADLDHFKEFNDRYGYNNGDRIIRLLARILHDVVKGECGEAGFVGHIGGDDFLFIVPLDGVQDSCQEIITVFDLLAPLQYSEQDQRAGYFFGKDRRGRLHRVPLMTLSIGVVTNARRRFVRASQVSELATEMKSYAKSLPGSVFSVDRRSELPSDSPEGASAEDLPESMAEESEELVEMDGSYVGEGPGGEGRNGSRGPARITRAIAQLGED